ncbi:hypothetical protein TcWFU_008937 [Taenia crassiceps]|uniref:Secreted protein n=1 Tax=Taenia crassiceps TaxID=6207 RepID=A0ABR4QBJ7_9CEST
MTLSCRWPCGGVANAAAVTCLFDGLKLVGRGRFPLVLSLYPPLTTVSRFPHGKSRVFSCIPSAGSDASGVPTSRLFIVSSSSFFRAEVAANIGSGELWSSSQKSP